MNTTIEIKTCSKCKEEKQIDEFNRDSSRKDGRDYLCRKCQNQKNRRLSRRRKHLPKTEPNSKTCNTCLEEKQIEDFGFWSYGKDGRSKACRVCWRNRYAVMKLDLVMSTSGRCADCGYSKNLAALDFHHLSDKSFGLGTQNFSKKRWEEILNEVKKCILLCANCHRERHNPELSMEKLMDVRRKCGNDESN